jgi:hypothetical protein
MVEGIVFIPMQRAMPDVIGVLVSEDNIIDVMKWCDGSISYSTETNKLFMRYRETPAKPNQELAPGYVPAPTIKEVVEGDWLLFDGDRFYTVTTEEIVVDWRRTE